MNPGRHSRSLNSTHHPRRLSGSQEVLRVYEPQWCVTCDGGSGFLLDPVSPQPCQKLSTSWATQGCGWRAHLERGERLRHTTQHLQEARRWLLHAWGHLRGLSDRVLVAGLALNRARSCPRAGPSPRLCAGCWLNGEGSCGAACKSARTVARSLARSS